MLVGHVNHMLDEKKRIRIPLPYKALMTSDLIMCVSVNGCIGVYTQEAFDKAFSAYNERTGFDAKFEMYYTKFLSNCFNVSADQQGRIIVPEALRKFAGIKKAVTTVGKSDHLEIWATERYEELNDVDSLNEMFEALNEMVSKQ